MRLSKWYVKMETCDDSEMFTTLAAYSQANYPMCCSVGRGGTEQRRSDGLLCKHEYSILQIVEAYGVRLVQLRNPWGKDGEWIGPWSDDSPDWNDNPHIHADP